MSESDPTPTDLTFASVDELVEELSRRHRSALFCLEKTGEVGDGETLTMIEYHGPLSTCIGLASRAHHRLLNEANRLEDDE